MAIADGLIEGRPPDIYRFSSNNLWSVEPGKSIAELAADAVKIRGAHRPASDHGKSFEDVKACIDAGFTSIMMDASHLS